MHFVTQVCLHFWNLWSLTDFYTNVDLVHEQIFPVYVGSLVFIPIFNFEKLASNEH
jgi:hypothetical protein